MTLPPPRAAYLHIPFCLRRCFYCDFPVVALGDKADGSRSQGIARYLTLLTEEIASSPPGPPLSSVYFGGGTPSLLTAEQVEGLLEALRRRFGLAPGAEITLEMDPATFDQARLQAVLRCGVNRVSLGGQSFDDAVLQALGRHHRRHHLLEAAGWLRQARQEGMVRSWSLDLIQGVPPRVGEPALCSLPQEGLAHWQHQLEQAIQLAPPHLSIYDLTIEPGTVFARRLERGTLELPDHDLGADVMDTTALLLGRAGYGRYEISNYAWPGHASRHNRVYWSGAGWWGFGMGATSAPDGRRLARPRTREGYADWLQHTRLTQGTSSLTRAEAPHPFPWDERVIVGMRRREGVNMRELLDELGPGSACLEALQARLAPWIEGGWLCLEGERWRLSNPAGLALSNSVLRDVLEWWEEQPCSRGAAVDESSRAGRQPPIPVHPEGEGKRGADDP